MTRHINFITHPNVVISPDVPVDQWPLSELGRARMHKMLDQPWIAEITAIYCSTEQKAVDGAAILAEHLSLPFKRVSALGENDRSSTGYLPADEFELMADLFFAQPDKSVRGWERAIDAQDRIVTAVTDLAAADTSLGPIAIVAHGAVGALLYCAAAGKPISRDYDQPGTGGGNYFRCSSEPLWAEHGWRAIDCLS